MQSSSLKRPTHAILSQFVSSVLPPRPTDVPLLYHIPRHPSYNASNAVVERVILSITATPGVYEAIGHSEEHIADNRDSERQEQLFADSEEVSRAGRVRSPRTACFLHRPFGLDRRRIRKGTLVLASHTSFDEHLTVGYNAALAARLGIVADYTCIQGYKGDSERKIGIVGQVSMLQGLLVRRVQQEFGALEHIEEGASDEVHVVAIMNAFHAEEVQRVLQTAIDQGWLESLSETPGRNVLYLTGQPRESGMQAAKAAGMTVVCVGHRIAEQWGIRYLASRIRSAFPSISVEEIFEEETLVSRKNAIQKKP